MKNKGDVFKAVAFVITLVATIMIWFGISLKSQPISLIQYNKSRTMVLNPTDDEWVDNFDSSYVDATTGCLTLTHKSTTKYGRIQ